jgi:hypothetical protein
LSDDPDDAQREAFTILLHKERDRVVKALRKELGGTVEDLFLFFWRSYAGFMDPEPGDEDYVEETDSDILNCTSRDPI